MDDEIHEWGVGPKTGQWALRPPTLSHWLIWLIGWGFFRAPFFWSGPKIRPALRFRLLDTLADSSGD